MKKLLLIPALAASFTVGFAFNVLLMSGNKPPVSKGRATGIGGIFFKCQDPKQIREWYKTHLGMEVSPYGATFEWREAADSTKKGATQWTPFSAKTKYFEPSTKEFMVNYRVENLAALVEAFKRDGVTVLDTVVTYDYGKFVHVLDVEGNKIELWEPTGK